MQVITCLPPPPCFISGSAVPSTVDSGSSLKTDYLINLLTSFNYMSYDFKGEENDNPRQKEQQLPNSEG